ncbi:porin, partial [Pseudoalteromonas sp. S3178]
MLKQVALVSALFASTASLANSTDFVELGYGKITLDGVDEFKPTGIAVTVNKAFDGFYLQGTYAALSDDFKGTSIESDYYANIETTVKVETDLNYLTLL